jgi:hypothetical protein
MCWLWTITSHIIAPVVLASLGFIYHLLTKKGWEIIHPKKKKEGDVYSLTRRIYRHE